MRHPEIQQQVPHQGDVVLRGGKGGHLTAAVTGLRLVRPSGTIGVFAPSSRIDSTIGEWVERGCRRMEELGFSVRKGRSLDLGHSFAAGTGSERWNDLKSMLVDDEVDLVVSAMGGNNCIDMLPYIEEDVFLSHPKPVMGYSDPTVLFNALTTLTGVPTIYGFHAASFDPQWPWFGEYDLESFRRVLMDGSAPVPVPPFKPRETWQSGVATGRLVGGCLSDLMRLIGTRFEPNWDGALLFLEDVNETPQSISANLRHLQVLGVFERISGILLGTFHDCDDADKPHRDEPLRQTFDDVVSCYDFPVMKTVDFGHFSHIFPLPIGTLAYMNADAQALELLGCRESPS